ncbi:MAG: carbohydrate kinase [candidate division Zixibacteria bacterium]|nr:carbohydrate kinase [candidate division Zixibacteria bacterium]
MPEIICAGILVADMIGWPIQRFPEYGRLELVNNMELHTGGCAINTGMALRKLGVGVAVVGKVGQNGLGDFVVERLEEAGLNVSGVRRSQTCNTSATMVMVSDTGERSFLHYVGANADLRLDDFELKGFADAKILHIGGALVLPGLDGAPMADLLRQAKDLGLTTSVDTVWDATGRWMSVLAPCLPHTDVFLPSIEEARQLTCEQEPERVAEALLVRGVGIVALKMGEKGCLVANEKEAHHVPAVPVEAVDTTGAGDCFAAGFLVGTLRGWSLHRVARFANAAGAACVTSVGASTGVKSFEETLALIKDQV